MLILTKHKKKGLEGFQKYVEFLETTPPNKARDIIAVALLEDPVYMKWVMENMISFEYILNLDTDELEKIYSILPSPAPTFVYALYKFSDENKIIEKLIHKTRARYNEEKSLTKDVQQAQQVTSRITILQNIRFMQKRKEITPYDWKIPDNKVLNGDNAIITEENKYLLNFENNSPALRGIMEKKLRAGLWKHYYPNGSLMAEGIYVDGEKEGPWKFYYKDGKIRSNGDFFENLKSGNWKEFDRNGNDQIVVYKRGKVF